MLLWETTYYNDQCVFLYNYIKEYIIKKKFNFFHYSFDFIQFIINYMRKINNFCSVSLKLR